MRDYAKRQTGGRQRVAGKRAPRRGEDRRTVFKLIGVVSVGALLLAVVSSFWFGIALRDGLARLDQARQERVVLAANSSTLTEQREALLQQEKVQLAAGALGLFPPSDKQLRRP